MQFAHTLKERKVLNVLRLDLIRQTVVVDTFPFRLRVGFRSKRNVFGNNGFDLSRHFLYLRMGQGLDAEVVILLKLILDNVMSFIKSGNNILVKNLIAR